jgi:hypothetical protein
MPKILHALKSATGSKCAAALARCAVMDELLQQLDPDNYREARLDMLRAAIEQLLRAREALAGVERRSQIPLATSRDLPGVCRTW